MNMKGNLKLKFRRLMRCLGFAKLKVHAKACAFSNTHMDSPKYHESFSLQLSHLCELYSPAHSWKLVPTRTLTVQSVNPSVHQILETCYFFSCKSIFKLDHLLHSVLNPIQQTNSGTAEEKSRKKIKTTRSKVDKVLFGLLLLLREKKIQNVTWNNHLVLKPFSCSSALTIFFCLSLLREAGKVVFYSLFPAQKISENQRAGTLRSQHKIYRENIQYYPHLGKLQIITFFI